MEIYIEKRNGTYLAKTITKEAMVYSAKTIETLKNRIEKDLKKRNNDVPKIHYTYSLRSFLLEVKPYVKQNAIASCAGLSNVTLSYYIKGERNPTEKNFKQTINAVNKIIDFLKIHKF